MKIFSYSCGNHDSSYAIYDGEKIVCHEELERHTRIKECNSDVIDFYTKFVGPIEDFDIVVDYPHIDESLYPRRRKEIIESEEVDVYQVGHHSSHAANAFFSSNLDEAMIFTLDGGGWDLVDGKLMASATTVWTGKGNKIIPLKLFSDKEINLGMFWSTFLKEYFDLSYSGPPYGCQAGTVMAMAAMGDPEKYYDKIINQAAKIPQFKILFPSKQDKYDMAASIQKITEQQIKGLMDEMFRQYGYKYKNVCLSGGTVLNSVSMGKIWDWFPHLENIYIPPVPYDAGLAIGNIQYLLHQTFDEPRIKYENNFTPYLGKSYSLDVVNEALKDERLTFRDSNVDDLVDLLTDQKIVSVFNGGSESGRRALGNRSILADPRSESMKDMINKKVKHRAWFRPFAPSIIREEVKNWFTRDIDSPYMGFVIPFKEEMKSKVPAVVHLDGSARLQTVTQKDNKWYYSLIKRFGEKTGVPILLNTSFNDREPIVETPQDAVNCFLKTNIDHLYFNIEGKGILVSKI